MKKRTPEAVISELLELVPSRIVEKTKTFYYADAMRKKPDTSAEKLGLVDAVNTEAHNFYTNQEEEPGFYYISHQAKDGILAGHLLERGLKEKEEFSAVVYNPEIDEKHPSSYIDKKALAKEAEEAGFAKRKKLPLWQPLTTVIAGVGSVTILLEFFAAIGLTEKIKSILGSLGSVFLYLFVFALFVGAVVAMIFQNRKNDREFFEDVDEKIRTLDDKEYFAFMEEFDDNEFLIPQCLSAKGASTVFICSLQCYGARQKRVLKAFWNSLSEKQLWVVFAEQREVNLEMVMDGYEGVKTAFYYMKPIAGKEKKHIAEKTYKDQIKFDPSTDSAIKKNGVDYVCRSRLSEYVPVISAADLDAKITEFCKQYVNYSVDIKLVIRLVAELSCTYGVDFTNRRKWEYLFANNHSDAELVTLDNEATNNLGMKQAGFHNLIPEIVHVFGDCFEEIKDSYPDSECTAAYKQWCLIKALKSREETSEDRLYVIADVMREELSEAENYPEDMFDSIWIGIIGKTLKLFYSAGFFWILPTLIHHVVSIFQNRAGQYPAKVFSLPIVRDVARANLLLNVESDKDFDSDMNIDLIEDHYRVLQGVVAEQKVQYDLTVQRDVCRGLTLLRLEDEDRLRYGNLLFHLEENDVIDYYNYVHDIYVASLLLYNKDMRYVCNKIYNNSLYEKHGIPAKRKDPRANEYIEIILVKLLQIMKKRYGADFPFVSAAVESLFALLKSPDNQPLGEEVFLLLMEFDIMDTLTFSFVTCLVARLKGSEDIAKEVYLGFENYLIGLVFLTYHEVRSPDWYNSDFNFLVRIAVGYNNPPELILGYLVFISTRSIPKYSMEQVVSYLEKYRSAYTDGLMKVAENIDSSDLSDFVVFLRCLNQIEAERNQCYQILKSRLLESDDSFAKESKRDALVEAITLLSEGVHWEAFENLEPSEVLEKLSVLDKDLFYLAYSECVDKYGNGYLELCHKYAEKVLFSNMMNRSALVFKYFISNINEQTEECVETERFLWAYYNKQLHVLTVEMVDQALRFVFLMSGKKRNAPDIYSWLDDTKTSYLESALIVRKTDIELVLAKEYLNIRSWSKYGIAHYIRYLFRYANCRFILKYPEEWAEKDEGQKIGHIMENYKSIEPTFLKDNITYFNGIYADMIEAFIRNTNDIQHVIDEKECLRKFVYDAMKIVGDISQLEGGGKRNILQMLSAYANVVDRM